MKFGGTPGADRPRCRGLKSAPGVPRRVDLARTRSSGWRASPWRSPGLQEADRDDGLAALVDQPLDVGGVVAWRLAASPRCHVARRLGVVEALLGEVVEALVAEAAGVERDAGESLSALVAVAGGRAAAPCRHRPAKMMAADAPSASSRLEIVKCCSSSNETPALHGTPVVRRRIR